MPYVKPFSTSSHVASRPSSPAPLRVGLPGDYRPFAIRVEGKLQGHDVELSELLSFYLGRSVEFVETSWPTLERDLLCDKFDFAAGGITPTQERRALANFLPNYAPFFKVALVNAETAPRIRTPEDLNRPDIRVIKNPGGTNELWVNEHLPNASIRTVYENAAIPGMIAEGLGDVMITDSFEAVWYASTDPRLAVRFADMSGSRLTLVQWKAFMVSPKSPTLYQSLMNAWHQIELSGEMHALTLKWLQKKLPDTKSVNTSAGHAF